MNEQLVNGLLAAVDGDEHTAGLIKFFAESVPESAVVRITEAIRAGKARSPAGYAIGALKREIALREGQ